MAVDLVGPAMQGVLTCVSDALTNSVALESLVPGGEVAWDVCDCDGQLWVRLINVVPSGQQSNCPPTMWDVTLGIGVVRCIKNLDDAGNSPTAAELTADALKMTVDQADIYAGLICCASSVAGIQKTPTIGTWNPVGALGGCAGGEWQATIKVGTCNCDG